uniref:Uncharacterized protein n=1 Tax=Lepeophtheirus salmonis TaxID=72036 RepID=A0A0K2UBK0_LEPSM
MESYGHDLHCRKEAIYSTACQGCY